MHRFPTAITSVVSRPSCARFASVRLRTAVSSTAGARSMTASAKRRCITFHVARCGDRWTTDDGVTLSVLSPCGALFADGKNDVNENSVVVMLAYRDFHMLFMGDAGFQAEHRLLETGTDVRADVLKVGHHGSKFSSAPGFVAAVHPRYALVSAGRHNLFGHPAATTLATLRAAGAAVYRTDLCGAIIVESGTEPRTTTTLGC